MIKHLISLLFIVTCAYTATGLAQSRSNKFTVNGYVKDSQTGEALIGALCTFLQLMQVTCDEGSLLGSTPTLDLAREK